MRKSSSEYRLGESAIYSDAGTRQSCRERLGRRSPGRGQLSPYEANQHDLQAGQLLKTSAHRPARTHLGATWTRNSTASRDPAPGPRGANHPHYPPARGEIMIIPDVSGPGEWTRIFQRAHNDRYINDCARTRSRNATSDRRRR